MNNTAKKVISWILAVIFGLSLVPALIFTAAEWVIFDTDRFMSAYEKEDIGSITGMDDENLRKVTDHMLNYLCDKEEYFNLTATIRGEDRFVFGEREILHMVDVKELFLAAFDIRTFCFVLSLVCMAAVILLRKRSSIAPLCAGYWIGLGIFAAILGIMGIFVAQDFNSFFMKFHFMFFDNDLWLLDPRYEVLIQMLPESFFHSVVVALLGWGITILLVPAAAAGILFGWDRARRKV